MKIQHITACTNPATAQVNLFGLGDDNKTYAWSYALGGWLPNWNNEAEAKKVENRQARRAAAAKKGGQKRKPAKKK